MDLEIKIAGASSRDIEQLLNTITPASRSGIPQPFVQDVSSSIEAQALLRQLEVLSTGLEELRLAQQNQSQLQPRHVVYSQPQISAGPVFAALPPSPDPAEVARYRTQPLPTVVQEIPLEEGYKMPAWVDKCSSAAVMAMVGVAIGTVVLPLIRPLFQQAPAAPDAKVLPSPPPKSNANSANLLKVPPQKPPVSESKNPPPIDVLRLPAIP